MPLKGNLGFISQSGALITGILDWSLNEGLGFSKFVSVGNKLDVDEVDLIKEMGRDKNTDVILAYLEMISKGDEFIKVCKEVAKRKPIIVIKSGTSSAGARAASSHTGSMAGANTAYDAAFEKAGVIRAESVEELFDTATAFSSQPLPKSPNLCIITNAGGPGIIATDHAEKVGLNLPTLSGNTINYLRENLPPAAAFTNPVDVLGTGAENDYRIAMEAVLKDELVDMVLIILTPQGMTEPEKTAEMVIELHKKFPMKPVAVAYMGGFELIDGTKIFKDNDVPCFPFPERAANALAGLWKYTQIKQRLKEKSYYTEFDGVDKEIVEEIFESVANKGRVQLLGSEAIAVARAYGIAAPLTKTAFTVGEAARYGEDIDFPVVMKITSPDIVHKTDIGGVYIGVESANEVRYRFKQMMRSARKHFPETKVIGVDIQKMEKTGYELIIGVSMDPQWGHLCIIGGGGIYTNIYQDVSFSLVPVSNKEASNMLKATKIYQILQGARGLERADIPAIIETLERISALLTDFPEILDLDINPLFAFKDGVSAVDVKIKISHERIERIYTEE
jgi:acetyltransferase